MELFAVIANLAKANLSPMQLYNWIFDFYLHTLSDVCAINIFNVDYSPNILTYIYVASINSFFIFFLVMLGNNDIVSILQCASCMNFCLQGMVKYATLYFYAGDIRKNFAQIKQMYLQNRLQGTEMFKILLKWTAFVIGLCKIVCVLISMMGLLLLLRPLAVYFTTRESVMMVPVWVPGIDETTTSGYWLSTFYHVFVLALAIVGTIGSDTLLIIFVVYAWPMCEIFDSMFRIINETARNSSMRHSNRFRLFIRNTIQMHKEICCFNSRVSKIYYYQCTVEVNTNGFSLCACVFCIFALQWQPAYFLGFLSGFKLLSYCLLGTIAESASDRIYRSIQQSNWYLLPLAEQHYVRQMIVQAQRPVILKAGVEELNLQLFVAIMKTVYSVSMILAETVED